MAVNYTLPPTNYNSALATDFESDAELCGYSEECGLIRFTYVMLGSAMATCGCFFNMILIAAFIRKMKSATQPTLYPTVLAVLDLLICFFYLLLFGVDAAAIYLYHGTLFRIYHAYVVPAFVASKMTQFAIPYMLIFATLERLFWITGDRRKHFLTTRGRNIILVVTLLICVALRIPSYFALYVKAYEQCPEVVRSLAVEPCQWAVESEFYYFYDFHAIVFLQTFLPFFLLVFLNVIIVGRLKRSDEKMEKVGLGRCVNEQVTMFLHDQNIRQMYRIQKTRMLRNAVYTMLAIVTSHLVCNSLHLILTIMERSNSSLLVTENDETLASPLHTVLGDTISLLYMFSSALRIAIYSKCNPALRQHLLEVLPDYCCNVKTNAKHTRSKQLLSNIPQST